MTNSPVSHVVSEKLVKEEPDQYGQQHPIENSDVLEESLQLMNKEINKLSKTNWPDMYEAMEKCTVAKTDAHKLLFLRCEQFNADMAALRLANYWKQRVELFGSTAFESELTIASLSGDGSFALKTGFIQILTQKDSKGRAMAFIQPRNLSASYSRIGMLKALWYIVDILLKEVSAQQKGVVFLIDLTGSEMRHFDIPLVQMCAESIRGTLPLRMSAMHFCQPPFLFYLFSGVVKFALGERLRKRVYVHSQWWNKEDDQGSLQNFGFTKDNIPRELGGELAVNHAYWVEQMEICEGKE